MNEVGWTLGFFSYLVIWWISLFLVLPFGAKSYHEAGRPADSPGAEGAPVNPHIKRKILANTVLSSVIWLLWYFGMTRGWFGLI